MGAGLARLETTAAHFFSRRLNPVHPQAEMVQPRAMCVEPLLQRVILPERLYELQMRVAQVQVRKPKVSIADKLGEENRKAKAVAPRSQSLIRIRYDNGQVIKPIEHLRLP
jgi:hypothetical protein